jgi:hypothetical protein
MEDDMGKFAAAGFDIAIMTLICVTLFAGPPAFTTSRVMVECPAPVPLILTR